MAVNTILLDFSVEPSRLNDEGVRTQILEIMKETLVEHWPEVFNAMQVVHETRLMGDQRSYLSTFEASGGITVAIRMYLAGMVTLNVEYYKEEVAAALFTFDSFRAVERKVTKHLHLSRGHTIPPISRGPIAKYFPTSDERIIEYDIDEVVFEQQSDFQKVQIVHSKSLGNMLVLDELQNLAESDLIYTETLMMRGQENYAGREICILGGGDGALLYELLKENPGHVVMLEIDDLVMQACNQHMRSVCGDVLETRKRDNYEIVVGDCMAKLEEYIAEGRKFDYVFGDLTDIPLSDTPTGHIWDFMRTILEKSFAIIKPGGKYMTHGNGSSCPESLRMYEQELKKLSPPVTFTTSKAFVPSFMEEWNFYQVMRQPQTNGVK